MPPTPPLRPLLPLYVVIFFGFVGYSLMITVFYMAVSLAYIVGPLGGGKLAEPAVVSWFTDATPERADVVGPDRAQPRRQRHAVWGGLGEWPW